MEIKNIFDWLNQITYFKSSAESFTDEDWEKWNSYMVNRFVSMNPDYIELVNYVQTIPYENKKQLYNIYKEMLPKRKTFLKYIKAKQKPKSKELLFHVSSYFECSIREADDYIRLLNRKDLNSLLSQHGLEKQEIEKIFK